MEWLDRWVKRLHFLIVGKPKIEKERINLPEEMVHTNVKMSHKAHDVIEYWAMEQLVRYPEEFSQDTEEEKFKRAKGIVLQKALALYDASSREVLQGKRVGSAKLLSSLETEFTGLP